MSWIKQVFTDFQTVITAKFLNDLQDQIIQDETTMGGMVKGVKGNSEASYRSGNVNITKANVGLGNVDNTSDLDKPLSTAQRTALNGKVPTTRKVNDKALSADITLTPEDIEYSESTAYSDGKIGKKISELSRKSDMTGVDEWYDQNLWQVGHIMSLYGVDSDSPTYNRMRTKTFIPENVFQIVTDANYGFYIYCYDKADGSYIGMWNGTTTVKEWTDRWHTGTVGIKALQESYRLRILANRQGGAAPQLTPEDNAQMFRFVSFTDESLSASGKAADAKVTGDRLNALGIYDTTSGDIAVFDDGADGVPIRKLVATIDAGQDLHGYSHPWIGGYGKNLYAPPSEAVTNNGVTLTPNEDGSITLNGPASSSSGMFMLPVEIPSGTTVTIGLNNTDVNADVGVRLLSTIDGGSGTQYGTMVVADAVNKKLTFTTTFDAKSINVFAKTNHGVVNITLKVMVELGSTSGAFEPYENICPFTGHTGMTGKRTGKNLYDIRQASSDTTENTLTRNGNELVWTANNRMWAGYSMTREKRIMLRAGVTYTVSAYCTVLARDANYTPKLSLRNNNATMIATANFPSTDNTEQRISFQYTPSENIVVFMSAVITGSTAGDASVRVRNPMVEIGSAVTDYEPYAETDISVTFPSTAGDNGTIFGATMDVVSGVLTVDKRKAVIDGNRTLFNVAARTNTVRFAVSVSPAMAGGVSVPINVISDKLPYKPFSFYNSDIIGVCGWRGFANENPGLWMSIPIEAGSTDASIKAWLNANPITCIYPLKDPVQYQLTPQEVTTLLGHNVVQTDVGPVSVTAARDGKLYIEGKIAELQALILENNG